MMFEFLFGLVAWVLGAKPSPQAGLPSQRMVAQHPVVGEKLPVLGGGKRVGVTTDMAEKMKVPERESRELRQTNVLDALEQAIHGRKPVSKGGLIHHSNRGSQHLSIKYTERSAEAGIEPSVGSVGGSYDNALLETINGLYKAEVIHRRGSWKSFEAVAFATLAWVDWFQPQAIARTLGFHSARRSRGKRLRSNRSHGQHAHGRIT